MKNYKERLYASYVSTHILPRKGEANTEEFRGRSSAYRKQFGRFLPEDKSSKIVDLGCGNGSIVWWLQRDGFSNTEGVDISAEQVKVAKELGVKNIKRADLKEFLKDVEDLYDVIFARDIIEHLNKEEIVGILDICYRALKDGGIVLIQVPNAESPFFGRIRYGDFTHEVAFTSSSLSQLLRMVGFAKLEFHSPRPRIHGVGSLIRFILWKIVETCYKFFLLVETGPGRRIVTQDIIAVAKKSAHQV